jgi:hypothetical protein
MKKNSILITLLFILVVSCGYKPIYLNKKNNFDIKKIEIVKASRLNTFIKNNLNNNSNKNSEKKISLLINSKKIKSIASKDSKGNPELLVMSLSVNLNILKNDKKKAEKRFLESFTYSNNTNKLSLSKYEKSIEKNLKDKINKNINEYLISF